MVEPLAAAIGLDLPLQDRACSLIVLLTRSATDVAVFTESRLEVSRCVRKGCDTLNEAIVQYMKRAYNFNVSDSTAEEIRVKIGSVYPLEKELALQVKGRDMVAGLPKVLTITSQELREPLLEPLVPIFDRLREALDRCPPELSASLWIVAQFWQVRGRYWLDSHVCSLKRPAYLLTLLKILGGKWSREPERRFSDKSLLRMAASIDSRSKSQTAGEAYP